MKTKLTTLVICILLSSHLMAQEKSDSSLTKLNSRQLNYKHAISICPMAFIMGELYISYEYLLNQTHGLAIMLDYQAETKTYEDPSFTLDRASVFLNYRYHFSKKMNSLFIGPYLRARFYDGKVGATGSLDFNDPEITLALYLGKRWVWNNGFNVTLTGGYGPYLRESRESRGEFVDKYFGELSIGYAF
jgi:hypothetical protein